MTQSTIVISRDIDPVRWNSFLAEFTRENRGGHARLEVLGSDPPRVVETEDRPFDGIAADVKDGENIVWIAFGSTPDDHLTHGIHGVKAIQVRPPTGNAGAAVEIETNDGVRTLLQLSRPEEYALPPGTAGKRQS